MSFRVERRMILAFAGACFGAYLVEPPSGANVIAGMVGFLIGDLVFRRAIKPILNAQDARIARWFGRAK